jgi:hypothetical protein
MDLNLMRIERGSEINLEFYNTFTRDQTKVPIATIAPSTDFLVAAFVAA